MPRVLRACAGTCSILAGAAIVVGLPVGLFGVPGALSTAAALVAVLVIIDKRAAARRKAHR